MGNLLTACCKSCVTGELLPSHALGDFFLAMWFVVVLNVFLTPCLLVVWSIKTYLYPCFVNLLGSCCCVCLHTLLPNCCFQFKDSEFPYNDSNSGKANTKWARLSEINVTIDSSSPLSGLVPGVNSEQNKTTTKITKLFNSISPNDIAQGALGDCWLLAALATLAEHPHLIQNAFLTRSFDPRGKYSMRLYDTKANIFKNITIDDFIPVDAANKPLFTKAGSNEMWPLLIEKAFAKMRGGYHALEGGLPLDAMMTITGFAGERLDIDTNEDAKVFHKMKKMCDAGCIMACGTRGTDNTRQDGRDSVKGSLVGGHAYSILGIYEPTLTTEKVRLLKLRNPWGSFEWQGAWSDKDSRWSTYPGVALEVGKPKDVDDGIFFIEWNDFIKHYDLVDILFPQTSLGDLHINIHEEAPCSIVCGPVLGCMLGCTKFWCMCQGLVSLWCAKTSQQLKKEIDLTYKV